MRRVRFISAHRGDADSFQKTALFYSVAFRHDLYVRLNNRDGLPKVYNRFLNGDYGGFTYVGENPSPPAAEDILVFLHDDVQIMSTEVEAALNRGAARGWTIMGLAGAASAKIEAPTKWHKMAPMEHWRGGCVFHAQFLDKKGQPVMRPDSPKLSFPGPTGEVVVLDGLLLAVVADRAREAGWSFDERFDFHHYDAASCLGARQKGLKLGTIFLPVVHYSMGLKDPDDPAWHRNQKVFLKAFADQPYWAIDDLD